MAYLTKDNPITRTDFGPIPPEIQNDRRAIAEEETRRDLTKTYEQLLADSHHEITDPNPTRGPMVNLGFSNRRIAGITVRAAMSMDAATRESTKSTTALNRLTGALTILTILLLAATALLACGSQLRRTAI